MDQSTTLGTVLTFDGDKLDNGDTIAFTPSRPSNAEAIVIGWLYMEADEQEQDALLNQHGPVLVRRSLRAFSNYAARTGQREVAEYAALLRDEITVLHPTTTGEEVAS